MIHDGRGACSTQRHLHQRRLQLLSPFVEHGSLIQDEAHACVMCISDVQRVRQPQQWHHQAVGDVDALSGDVTQHGDGHATLLGEARHHLGQIEAVVEQLDAAHRDKRDLSTLDRIERRRTCAQRAGPFHTSLEPGAAGEKLGALREDASPHVLDGDRRSAHADL